VRLSFDSRTGKSCGTVALPCFEVATSCARHARGWGGPSRAVYDRSLDAVWCGDHARADAILAADPQLVARAAKGFASGRRRRSKQQPSSGLGDASLRISSNGAVAAWRHAVTLGGAPRQPRHGGGSLTACSADRRARSSIPRNRDGGLIHGALDPWGFRLGDTTSALACFLARALAWTRRHCQPDTMRSIGCCASIS
jgi:hypothetical protein